MDIVDSIMHNTTILCLKWDHNELAEFKNLGQQLSAKVPDFDDLKVLRTLIKKKYGVVIVFQLSNGSIYLVVIINR